MVREVSFNIGPLVDILDVEEGKLSCLIETCVRGKFSAVLYSTVHTSVGELSCRIGLLFRPRSNISMGYFLPLQQIQQKFHKYPEPEYPFTYLDNLISGDITELTEATKFRRLLFNIVPPEVTGS